MDTERKGQAPQPPPRKAERQEDETEPAFARLKQACGRLSREIGATRREVAHTLKS